MISLRRYCRILSLLPVVYLAGCVSLGPYEVPECGVVGDEPLFSALLGPSSDEQVVRFEPPKNGDVCVTVKRIETFDGVAVPDQPVRIRMGPDPAVRALIGGSEIEFNFRDGDWRANQLAFAVQVSNGPEQSLRVITQDVAVLIEGIRRSFPEEPDFTIPEIPPYQGPGGIGGSSPATQAIKLPALTCDGRLLGFEHPLRFESPDAAAETRPEIHRGKVRVVCDAVWRIESVNRRSVIRRQSGAGTLTDANGVFSAIVPATTVTVQKGYNLDVFLERLEPRCEPSSLCGYEHRYDANAQRPELLAETVEAGNNEFYVDIVDTLDLIAHGPEAAGFHNMLGARLISNSASHPARNDKPFIIHEQVDVHDEEHTQFFVWGLSGQPVRLRWTDRRDDGKEKYVDPRVDPCEFKDEQICLPFDENCNPARCEDDDMACLEYPMLQSLLESGFDVWIVDNLRGDADITHAAAAGPLLYQKILNFGGPLPGAIAQPLDVVEPTIDATHAQDIKEYELVLDRYLRSLEEQRTVLTAELANKFLTENALPEGPIATAPQSGSRRAVVAGYSMGGVLARIALRMWETRDQFPHAVIRDQRDRPLEVATHQSVFMEEPSAKIALYVSLDVPHLGARVPVAVQAHLHRLKYAIDKIGGFKNGATRQVDKAIKELTATPARQVLQQEINPLYRNNSLGCFDPEDEDINNCRVTSLEPDVQSRLFDVESTLFQARWIDVISSLAPQTSNGLPATVPSIGFSNGALPETRTVASREVAKIKWHLTRGASDLNHRLCDEASGEVSGLDCTGGLEGGSIFGGTLRQPLAGTQPQGAQWNNICRRITDQRIDKGVGHCSGKGTTVKTCIAEVLGVELQKVSVDYRMRAKFKDGNLVTDTGFPTLVPTRSALFQDNNGNVSSAWRDAQWQSASQYHTNFDNDMCRIILFHADGAFDDDKDGWPACDNALRISDCRAGGRRPGLLLDPEGMLVDDAWCDRDSGNAAVHP